MPKKRARIDGVLIQVVADANWEKTVVSVTTERGKVVGGSIRDCLIQSMVGNYALNQKQHEFLRNVKP